MADSAVAVTSGTGTNIDTRTEATNGNHRQVIVIGDPATNAGVAPVDATTGLKVDLGADNDVTVTNGGTFVVQENGGALTALQIMDDWDESDRAKVNLIVGQAGVAAGAGASGVTTLRTISSTDDPGVTSLAVIDDWDETDRCKVNLIVGQAGVAGGAGTNGATVQRVTIATDDQSAANLNNALVGDYETVAASQTNQVLGPTGATGDYLAGVLIVPATTSPGNVIIIDNATSITIFTGGASSVSNLVPFMVPLGMRSVSGSWRITTGANVSAIGIGNFT